MDTITLRTLSTGELLDLFKTLSAPALTDLDGEYTATLLNQPVPLMRQVSWLGTHNPVLGNWTAKAFNGGRGGDGLTGQGYNNFRTGDDDLQRYPMLTTIAPSRYDGEPAFQLVYRAFNSLCGAVNMVDEVRTVSPGLYLGIGTYGFTRGQRMVPQPFELAGPVAEYRGDIGTRRAGFDLATALKP